jgi:hypothetical protein
MQSVRLSENSQFRVLEVIQLAGMALSAGSSLPPRRVRANSGQVADLADKNLLRHITLARILFDRVTPRGRQARQACKTIAEERKAGNCDPLLEYSKK